MASQPSLENRTSENSEQGITIGLIGLGHEGSLGQMFLTRFVRGPMLYLPIKEILVNNKDTKEKLLKVKNIIGGNLKEDIIENIDNPKKEERLEEFFTQNRIHDADTGEIRDNANLIILSVDYGFKEPELAPASRYVVFNNNMKIMHQRVSGPDSPRMFELLGDSKAHKLVLTNPVEYMCHFNMRELMKRRLMRDDLRNEFGYFLKEQVDKREWEIQEDLQGIPGKYLIAALKKLDKEYLSFLTKSWSGFVTSDISRQKKIVRDHVRKLFQETDELRGRKFKILYDELYFGEHGAISEPILSSIQVVPDDNGKRFDKEFEFPFRKGGKLNPILEETNRKTKSIRDQISAAIKAFTPKQYNQHGTWINTSVAQKIVPTVKGIIQYGTMCAATYHEDDMDPPNPMMFTLLAQYFPYFCDKEHAHTTNSGLTIGIRIADEIAHQEGEHKGSFNKECTRDLEGEEEPIQILDTDEIGKELSMPPLDQIGINDIIKGIQKTIRSGEINEMEVGIPHINSADTLVAVHDANNLEEILITSFQGRDIPAGAINIGRRVNKIASEGKNLVAYLSGGSGSKRLMRFKFREDFIFKNKYDMYNGVTYKDDVEHSPEGERFTFRATVLDQIQDFTIKDKKIYCLHHDKIEVRDIDSLEIIPELSITLDPLKNYSKIKIDPNGNIYLLDQRAQLANIFDSEKNEKKVPEMLSQNRIENMQFQGYFIQIDDPKDPNKKLWIEKQYLFCTEHDSPDILSLDVSDLDNITPVELVDKKKNNHGFAVGRYNNPAFPPQDPATKRLYVARIIPGSGGHSFLEIKFYRLNENNNTFEIDPDLEEIKKKYKIGESPNKSYNIRSDGNYVLVGNRLNLAARHAHNREWDKDLDKNHFNKIINFEFIKLR